MVALGNLFLLLFVFRTSRTQTSQTTPKPKPNIIMILADDLGWNDISLHGSNQFMTHNIDALGLSGVTLKNYYTQPICTPARAALLTGKHPIHTGMEHDVIYAPEPWGLPLTEKLLPQYLEKGNYISHAVGKWHLGIFKTDYTPTRRGFHSHYGNWLGSEDHYKHIAFPSHPGFDFHRNLNNSWDAQGKYTTDLLTDEAMSVIEEHNTSQPLFLYMAHVAPHAPLQAPQELIDTFDYIPDKKRRIFAAMVTKVDESVGKLVEALKHKDMLNNSIIIFLTDNGGATHGFNGNVASNYPLRGCKDTLWEGGVRGVGVIWSPLLQGTPRVHQGLVNVQDWLPTLITAANITIDWESPRLDGVSQWEALNDEAPSPYDTILHNIDPVRNISALRYGKWKIIVGRTYNGQYDGFYGKLNGEVEYNIDLIRKSLAGVAIQTTPAPLADDEKILALRADSTISCNPNAKGPHVIQSRQVNLKTARSTSKGAPSDCEPQIAACLFDISADPCETKNLASSNPNIVRELILMIESYNLVPPNNKPADPRSYPQNWNNTWVPWLDNA